MKVLPMCMGLIKNRGNASEIQISSFKMGDKYV